MTPATTCPHVGATGEQRTTDARIAEVTGREGRVVVTKDRDFRDGHSLSGSPRRLLIVGTGNITNTGLLGLFEANLGGVVGEMTRASSSWGRGRWSCTSGMDRVDLWPRFWPRTAVARCRCCPFRRP
ncbi:DUF5615 family PIN-like protein [Pseudonocardia sp. KRD-184]|uniref:DUF5615 family PIN-like protein n=1 Tax=Pseudonocardia oceani TaxID=2792013 RepID=A0ABS6U900_9PSEU|nr:DUF5615 family PIN-like protein [Pseudonocardia oceani]MBW0095528.1 DUF5615 family PIN-like protein [Pseudonocardia oceani]MBW0108491.1 DUF5615 family PIN-like protein [Pseudonocardia oceani]MBW0121539.1 DUF5615 family PIN-like protein [Pseudonocardia oceani]MBW0128720.1 DUF5615 family PIN-like protein [Pseudonocardia oceani]